MNECNAMEGLTEKGNREADEQGRYHECSPDGDRENAGAVMIWRNQFLQTQSYRGHGQRICRTR